MRICKYEHCCGCCEAGNPCIHVDDYTEHFCDECKIHLNKDKIYEIDNKELCEDCYNKIVDKG